MKSPRRSERSKRIPDDTADGGRRA